MEYNEEREMRRILIVLLCMIFVLIVFLNLVSAMTATVNIPEKYSEVTAGDKVYFETEIKWPENTERKDLRIEYSIRDKNNEEIAYLKVLKAIETQASFMDSISIPESTQPGLYKIYLNITDYKELNQEVVASFKIISKKNPINTYLPIILIFIGLIAILVVIELFILIKKRR